MIVGCRGARASRSGAHGLCGRRARRLTNPEKSFAGPSSLGLLKSKIDWRSPRRLSISVPLKRESHARLELLGCGAKALPSRGLSPSRRWNQGFPQCGFREIPDWPSSARVVR